MDLREEILKEQSKTQWEHIAAWIGDDRKRFKALVDLFLHDEYRVVQRSSNIISKVGDKHPGLIKPHIDAMVQRMTEPGIPVSVKRNVVRLLQTIPPPERLHGEVMNICFDLLADVRETIAVRCFSMTVLANLAKIYPDLKNELIALIEDEQAPSAGFVSRRNKVLKELRAIS